MSQRLIRNSKLTNGQLELIKYFALEVPARLKARVMSINRHSAECVYYIIRRCQTREYSCMAHWRRVECDARRRGADGKGSVFELLKHDGKVYTQNAPGRRDHINGIENFYGHAKTKLTG